MILEPNDNDTPNPVGGIPLLGEGDPTHSSSGDGDQICSSSGNTDGNVDEDINIVLLDTSDKDTANPIGGTPPSPERGVQPAARRERGIETYSQSEEGGQNLQLV